MGALIGFYAAPGKIWGNFYARFNQSSSPTNECSMEDLPLFSSRFLTITILCLHDNFVHERIVRSIHARTRHRKEVYETYSLQLWGNDCVRESLKRNAIRSCTRLLRFRQAVTWGSWLLSWHRFYNRHFLPFSKTSFIPMSWTSFRVFVRDSAQRDFPYFPCVAREEKQ